MTKRRARIVELAMQMRVPITGEFEPMAIAGALMSYGPNQVEMWPRSAVYVDKILNGANPAELPVEQPTRFDLVLNMKTAKALGVRIPQSILLRATEVIE